MHQQFHLFNMSMRQHSSNAFSFCRWFLLGFQDDVINNIGGGSKLFVLLIPAEFVITINETTRTKLHGSSETVCEPELPIS